MSTNVLNHRISIATGFAVAGYRFVTFTRWGDEMKHIRPFLIITVSAILQLLVENFFVWCFPPTIFCKGIHVDTIF